MKYLKYFEDIEDSLANELNGIYSAFLIKQLEKTLTDILEYINKKNNIPKSRIITNNENFGIFFKYDKKTKDGIIDILKIEILFTEGSINISFFINQNDFLNPRKNEFIICYKLLDYIKIYLDEYIVNRYIKHDEYLKCKIKVENIPKFIKELNEFEAFEFASKYNL